MAERMPNEILILPHLNRLAGKHSGLAQDWIGSAVYAEDFGRLKQLSGGFLENRPPTATPLLRSLNNPASGLPARKAWSDLEKSNLSAISAESNGHRTRALHFGASVHHRGM